LQSMEVIATITCALFTLRSKGLPYVSDSVAWKREKTS